MPDLIPKPSYDELEKMLDLQDALFKQSVLQRDRLIKKVEQLEQQLAIMEIEIIKLRHG